MHSDLFQALHQFAAASQAGGAAAAAEHSFELDELESLTAFRNAIDGGLLVSIARRIDRLDAKAARAYREAILRLTAETRFGESQVGLIEPSGAVALAVDVPPAAILDAASIEALLDATRARLAALSWAGDDDADAKQPTRFEETWIRA